MAGYSLELDLQDPWLCPFTFCAKPDCAHDGVKSSASCVCRKAWIVEPTGRFDSLSKHLHLGIGKRCHVMSQEIDARVIGLCLVGIQKLLDAGEHHLRDWLPIFIVHEAVEQRA